MLRRRKSSLTKEQASEPVSTDVSTGVKPAEDPAAVDSTTSERPLDRRDSSHAKIIGDLINAASNLNSSGRVPLKECASPRTSQLLKQASDKDLFDSGVDTMTPVDSPLVSPRGVTTKNHLNSSGRRLLIFIKDTTQDSAAPAGPTESSGPTQ